jgi:amino-acid N-acetyltransferase
LADRRFFAPWRLTPVSKRAFAFKLTKKAEDNAASFKIKELFLLTMTADSFFQKKGLSRIEKISAPPEMQSTTEFQNLCPAGSVCMVKVLVV